MKCRSQKLYEEQGPGTILRVGAKNCVKSGGPELYGVQGQELYEYQES